MLNPGEKRKKKLIIHSKHGIKQMKTLNQSLHSWCYSIVLLFFCCPEQFLHMSVAKQAYVTLIVKEGEQLYATQ